MFLDANSLFSLCLLFPFTCPSVNNSTQAPLSSPSSQSSLLREKKQEFFVVVSLWDKRQTILQFYPFSFFFFLFLFLFPLFKCSRSNGLGISSFVCLCNRRMKKRKDETSFCNFCCCFYCWCCPTPYSAYLSCPIPIPSLSPHQFLFSIALFLSLPPPSSRPLATLNTPLALPSHFLSLAGLEAVSVVFMRPLPLSCTMLL
ncbi:hypothetical protein BKA57DRAFT_27046 [Linnemannia elongata]|nr:hypothetical protein BKA57DRAFT_27046 [Linnemannia elongata]